MGKKVIVKARLISEPKYVYWIRELMKFNIAQTFVLQKNSAAPIK